MVRSLYLDPRKALLALLVGACLGAMALVWAPSELWPASLLLAFALSWAALVDIDRLILPDAITIGLVIVGLILAGLTSREALFNSLIGASAGYLSLVLVALAYRKLRQLEALGRGDAKLFAAAGAWLGWQDLPKVLLIASVSALIFVLCLWMSKRMSPSKPIAYGPFLAIGIWLAWLLSQGDQWKG